MDRGKGVVAYDGLRHPEVDVIPAKLKCSFRSEAETAFLDHPEHHRSVATLAI